MNTPEQAPRITVDYTRISHDPKGTAVGVGSQHGENLDYAGEIGAVISETFTDNDTSAFSGVDRPDYRRMIKGIRSGHIGRVIIWHADRLHRNTDEVGPFVRLAREHGVSLHSVARGEYRLNTADGRRALRDDTSGAEYESDHKGERVSLARKRQARQGSFGGGVRPFGWGVDTGRVRSVCDDPKAAPDDRTYTDRPVLDMGKHDPIEAEIIQGWAKDLLAGVPMNQILRGLAARGVKTSTGGSWSSRTIVQILINPRTSGHSTRGGEIVKRNAFEPIIPDDTREALITMFADPARRTAPGNTPKWLGSMIYECGVCRDGSTMTVRRNSRGEPIYRCRSRGHCARLAVDLDKAMEEIIIARLSQDLSAYLPTRQGVDAPKIREQIRHLESKMIKAAEQNLDDVITDEQLATITTGARRKITELRAKLADASGESPLIDFESGDARKVWTGLSLGRKREIIRLLVRVILEPVKHSDDLDPETIKLIWLDGPESETGS